MGSSLITIKSEKEFNYIFKQGKTFINRHFVLYVLPLSKKYKKVAFCAGKKLGKAVRRNKIRRRARRAFQLVSDRIKDGNYYILIARLPVYNEEFEVIIRSLEELLNRAGVLKEDN